MHTTTNIYLEHRNISMELMFIALSYDKLKQTPDGPEVRKELKTVEFYIEELATDLLDTGICYEC